MIRKYLIPFIALAGVAFAVYTVIWGDRPSPPPQSVSQAAQAPYQTFVAGSGLVESSSTNISIGSSVAGVVANIYVHVGSKVKIGDPLFSIDDRATRAKIETSRAAVQVAQSQLNEAKYNLALVEPLVAKGVMTHDNLMKMQFAEKTAAAQVTQARAELNSSQTELKLLTVKAPVDGEILQLKMRPGEFAPDAATAAGQPPLILLGSVNPLYVRVDVNESDAWRVHATAQAMGYLRGNKKIATPLKFVRFEPYVVPKTSLTGASAERVDTRVLQVLYSFTRGDLPIFVGQQMDVFIEAASLAQDSNTNSGSATR